MTWQTLNINARAKVKLSPHGHQVYEQHMASLRANLPPSLRANLPLIPKVDGDGWYEDQLWSIAHIFGSALYNGCDPPFETTILIEGDTT
jgi:hypothetical protein